MVKDKKEQPTKHENALRIIGLCVSIFAVFALFYAIYHNIRDGSFSIEFASHRFAKNQDRERYCCSNPINSDKAVAFINCDCTPINNITKGIQDCKGRYYVFLNKINNKWVVNESSKSVIW